MAYSKLKISLPEIVKSKGFSSLKTWVRIWGEENIEDFLYLAIDDICSYLNVGKNMSLIQIRQTAKLIMQRFPELSMEDIKAWSDSFKSGEYGKLYDRTDGQVLLETIELYEKAKMDAIESHHENIKYSGGDLTAENPLFKVLSEVSKKSDAKPIGKYDKPSKPIVPTETDKRMQHILSMFDWIYKRRPVTLPNGNRTSIKMIYIKGKPTDRDKFISIMLNKRLKYK